MAQGQKWKEKPELLNTYSELSEDDKTHKQNDGKQEMIRNRG